MTHICVFCGSNAGTRAAYAQAAADLGRALAVRGTTLVYGGGSIGLMKIAAESALAAQGKVQSFGRARARRWMTPPVPGFTTTLLLPVTLAND